MARRLSDAGAGPSSPFRSTATPPYTQNGVETSLLRRTHRPSTLSLVDVGADGVPARTFLHYARRMLALLDPA